MERNGYPFMDKEALINTLQHHFRTAGSPMKKELHGTWLQKVLNGDKISRHKFLGSVGDPDQLFSSKVSNENAYENIYTSGKYESNDEPVKHKRKE